MSRSLRHVLIIGGGVAGPALALFLRKAGISCAVYEAYPFVTGVGGGLGLAPNGVKVLAALGIAGELKRRAPSIARYAFRNDRGALLAAMRIDAPPNGEPMLAMSRALLFETLAAAMQRQHLETHYEKRLLHIEDRGGSVVAHFDDGTSAEGDLLIGADGVRSVVRGHLLPGAQADYTGMIGIGGFTPLAALPGFDPHTMTFVFGKRGFFGYSGADGNAAMWWSNLFLDREIPNDELVSLDVPAERRELLDRFGHYHTPIPALIGETRGLLRLNIYDVRSLPTWRRGRVVLIGDAAHAVSPSAGQGASLALEDAMYLAKLLRDASDVETALARFASDRKPRAERVVAEGRRRGADKAIVGPLQQRLRELMIRLFVPLFGRTSDRWLHEYDIAW